MYRFNAFFTVHTVPTAIGAYFLLWIRIMVKTKTHRKKALL